MPVYGATMEQPLPILQQKMDWAVILSGLFTKTTPEHSGSGQMVQAYARTMGNHLSIFKEWDGATDI
jgi:hypothetical protein